MRKRWTLLALLAVALVTFWALQMRQEGQLRLPETPERDGETLSPTLHGEVPTDTRPQNEPGRRERGPRQVTIRGRVADGADRPLSEAQVQAVSTEWRSKPATVDGEGRFAHEVVVMGAMRVSVTAPGHLPWLGPWLGADGGEGVDLGTVTLQAGHSLAGQVLFEDGLPASDILVAVVPEADGDGDIWLAWSWTDGRRYPTAETDSGGRFHIERIPTGTYTLIAAWGSWNEAAVEGVRADRRDVEVRIQRPQEGQESSPTSPPAQERVLVDLTTEDEGPVPKCYAALFAGESRWPGVQRGSRITFPVPAPGDYTLYVRPEGGRYASRVLRGCDVRPAPYVVPLRRALTVEGVVRVDGEPVAEASVRADGRLRDDGTVEAASPPEDWIVGHETWKAETDAQGRFRIVGIAPGAVELRASSRSYRQGGPALVVDAGSSGHVLTMRENPFISFRVHAPDGKDVGSVEVTIQRVAAGGLAWERRIADWALDADDGPRSIATFHVDVSDASAEYAVEASNESATADGMSPLVRGLRVGASPVDIYLHARRPLRVVVVDEGGRPLPGALVQLRRFPEGRPVLREPAHFVAKSRASPGWPDGGHTGPDGVYTFQRHIPPGPWTVLAQSVGTAQVGRLPRVEDDQESARVVLHRGLRLLGKVDDPEGRSQGARILEAWPLDRQQESVPITRLSHSGRFELTNLAPGRYVLVSRPNDSFHREEMNWHAISGPVPAGARGVRLTLRPGHDSTLDLRDPEDRRLSDAQVRVVGRFVDREVVADRDGLFRAIALPPGEYAFQVHIDGREPVSLEFKAGEHVTHRIR